MVIELIPKAVVVIRCLIIAMESAALPDKCSFTSLSLLICPYSL